MRKMYVAHPYGGKPENKAKVEDILLKLLDYEEDVLFISPIHALGFMYHDVDYITGMDYCLELLGTCDGLVLCDGWEESRGCCMEYAYATAQGKDIYLAKLSYTGAIHVVQF